jgi:transposase
MLVGMKNHEHTESLGAHYARLLGLSDPWIVTDTALDIAAASLDIRIAVTDAVTLPCPVCGNAALLYDLREERRWRHLDTMQFTTTIIARIPRVTCSVDGIKTARTPWAGDRSRFTMLFERFAIDVLLATTNVTRAMGILRISWDQVQLIQERAVARGMKRRSKDDTLHHVGIDEKSFLKGHRYASLAVDLDHPRVLDVVEHRTKEAAITLLTQAIPEEARADITAGAMDMWQPFMDAWVAVVGHEAPIVHDKFHVSGYLGKAVDKVRKKEHREFKKEGKETLTGAKYLFLKNPDSWDDAERAQFEALMTDELKVGRAWGIKEAFRTFWEYERPWAAKKFFDRWYFRATHSRLAPVIEAAKTLKRHLEGILAYITHRITNAATEGLNSKIQSIKASARGFRKFANYRIAILFHCGKLQLYP